MKTLVVYFSRSGNTKQVAEKLAEKLEADTEAITEPGSRKGPMGWLKSGTESARGIVPEISPINSNLSEYDLVVVGTPIWAGSVASPVRGFMVKHGKELKQAAFFCTMNGDSYEKTFEEMESHHGKEPVATAHFKAETIKDGSYLSDLDSYAAKLG